MDQSCDNSRALKVLYFISFSLLHLFIYLPHKVPTHRAEGGLFEEGGSELVILYKMNLGLFDGSSPSV